MAGCTDLGDTAPAGVGNSGATDLVLHSAATDPKTVAVTVTAADEAAPHTDRTLDLAPGQTVEAVNDSKLPTNVAYTVEGAVSGGPTETFEWADPRVELSPLWVVVDDSENVTFLLQAGYPDLFSGVSLRSTPAKRR